VRRSAVVLVVLPLLGGCGGGGGGGGSRLSHGELDSKGNAVCAKYNVQQRQVAQPRSLAELSPALRKLLKIGRNQADDLAKLTPPKADESAYDDLLAGAREENDLVADKLIPAAEKKNAPKVRALLQQVQAKDAALNDEARRLGLSACAASG
jgi:hypothetical protein